MKKKTNDKRETDGLPDCKKCMKENGGKCPDEIKPIRMAVCDLHALLDFAFNARFLLLALAPDYKKDTKGYRMMKCIDESGTFLRQMAKTVGFKSPVSLCDSDFGGKSDKSGGKKTVGKATKKTVKKGGK